MKKINFKFLIALVLFFSSFTVGYSRAVLALTCKNGVLSAYEPLYGGLTDEFRGWHYIGGGTCSGGNWTAIFYNRANNLPLIPGEMCEILNNGITFSSGQHEDFKEDENTQHYYLGDCQINIHNSNGARIDLNRSDVNKVSIDKSILVQNPFNETLKIHLLEDHEDLEIMIIDLHGKEVYYSRNMTADRVNKNEIEIELGSLNQSIYILKIYSVLNDSYHTFKVVKN